MRLIYFGSGDFGIPTLDRLARRHDVELVVSQPDRPAGRRRRLTPTPISRFAEDAKLPILKTNDVNDPQVRRHIHRVQADCWVVIAFGQKLGPELLAGRDSDEPGVLAINLHGSLLPKYRGAAPVQWAMINDEPVTGISIITLAQRMDAGDILAQERSEIDPMETADELHDRLAMMGPDLVDRVLDEYRTGTLRPVPQDESQATKAPKFRKEDGTVDFNQTARLVRARIHGLSPWPGCTVHVGDRTLRLLRARVEKRDHYEGSAKDESQIEPGTVMPGGTVKCADGCIQLISVQPPGGRAMTFEAYLRGHPFESPARMMPMYVET